MFLNIIESVLRNKFVISVQQGTTKNVNSFKVCLCMVVCSLLNYYQIAIFKLKLNVKSKTLISNVCTRTFCEKSRNQEKKIVLPFKFHAFLLSINNIAFIY